MVDSLVWFWCVAHARRLARVVADLGQRDAYFCQGVDHEVGLVVVHGVLAYLGPTHTLEELGEGLGLGGGEFDGEAAEIPTDDCLQLGWQPGEDDLPPQVRAGLGGGVAGEADTGE